MAKASIGVHVHMEGLNDLTRKMKQLDTSFSRRKYLDMIGIKLLNWSNEQFKTGGKAEGRILRWRKLRPNTVASRRKKSKKILQDTGRLRMSFVYKVHHSAQWVDMGTADKRAPWHHHGTRGPYPIPRTPKTGKKAIRFMTPSGPRFAKQVMHPGLPARPLTPTEANGRRMATIILNDYVDRTLKKAGLD